MRSRRGRTQFNLPFQVAGIVYAPREQWGEFVYSNLGRKRYANHLASVDWDKYSPDKYLLTHCSIISSVNVEDNGYYITPKSAKYVNANGNSWTTPVLKTIYKSFIGAESYYEHIQVPELSKGKILDAVLREVVDDDNEKIYYCDILVANNRKHVDLVPRIESGELSTLSMGAIVNVTQCSRCGKLFTDDTVSCVHIRTELGNFFIDENGQERIVAEHCGYNEPFNGILPEESCVFIEASWVERPAFAGAVVNHFITNPEKHAKVYERPDKMAKLFDAYNIRVADRSGRIAMRLADRFKTN